MALGEGVQPGPEHDVLGDAPGGPLENQVVEETGTGHDGGPEPAGGFGVHVQTVTPSLVRAGQSETDVVSEHVWRRVDLDVHRPPERHPERGALRHLVSFGSHQLLPGAWRIQALPSGSRTVISLVP